MVSNKKYSLINYQLELLEEATKMLVNTIRDELKEEGSTIDLISFEAILDKVINELTNKETDPRC